MVTFYEINQDGTAGNPVLYLDSLKVSTLEQTAETVYAQGGKGNPRLIGWDFGKEITLSLEDALFSPKSMAVMFGNGEVELSDNIVIKKTISYTGEKPTHWIDANGKSREILHVKGSISCYQQIFLGPQKRLHRYELQLAFHSRNA